MPVARTRPLARPTVRLRPVPPLDPPFDDEYASSDTGADPRWRDGRHAGLDRGRPVGIGRAPEFAIRSAPEPPPTPVPPATGPTRPARAAIPVPPATGSTRPARPTAGGAGPARPGTGPATARRSGPSGAGRPTDHGLTPEALAGATPEARQAATRFLTTCLEIVNGYRPAAQIRPLASPTDVAGIVEQLGAAGTRISGRRRPGQPVQTVRLQRLRVCEPRPGVAEAAAAVGIAGRTWAVAFRIERRRGSWLGVSVAVL